MANIDTHPEKTALAARSINWGAALWASIIGGLVFAALEVVLVPLVQEGSPWAPLHMIGAIALGSGAMASPDTFDLQVVSVAVVLHLALAIIYGVILAFVVARLDAGSATLLGAVYGFLLYLINFYAFTKWFPWFADARDWISIFTHVVQGALWGGLYKAFDGRTLPASA